MVTNSIAQCVPRRLVSRGWPTPSFVLSFPSLATPFSGPTSPFFHTFLSTLFLKAFP